MAENQDEITTAELEKLAIVEEGEGSSNYKAPAKVDLDTLKNMDTEDESLNKYKKKLLAGSEEILDVGGNNVLVKALIVQFPENTDQKDCELDLTGDLKKLKDNAIVVKDGAMYALNLKFRVQREIVSGLKFHYTLYRKGVKVYSENYMVGSFGPSAAETTAVLCKDTAPSGMLARGSYIAKSKFIDDDGNCHLECEWQLKIKKDWSKKE